MNWEAIGAIGEVVGAAAVVLTLWFLVGQLRQNTASLRAQALNATYSEWNSMAGELQVQPVLRQAYFKDRRKESMDSDEYRVLTTWLIRVLNVNDKAYHLYRGGAADAFNWENMERTVRDVVGRSSIFRDLWERQKWRYSSQFQVAIQGILRDSPVELDTSG